MPSTSTRERIIIEFAMWAATSATKLGCPVRGGAWYPHLRKVNLADLFELTAPVSSERFSIWHRREVEALASRAGVPVGWAAKLLNMLTKVSVYIARYGDSSLQDLIHPPIDNRLVDAVHREFPIKGPSAQPSNHQIRIRCGRGKPILGVVSYEQYLEVIQGVPVRCRAAQLHVVRDGAALETKRVTRISPELLHRLEGKLRQAMGIELEQNGTETGERQSVNY